MIQQVVLKSEKKLQRKVPTAKCENHILVQAHINHKRLDQSRAILCIAHQHSMVMI